jgi:hypothetical protein
MAEWLHSLLLVYQTHDISRCRVVFSVLLVATVTELRIKRTYRTKMPVEVLETIINGSRIVRRKIKMEKSGEERSLRGGRNMPTRLDSRIP